MASKKIESIIDFKCWVRTQLIMRNTSQMALAKKMNIAYPRISEAVNGHQAGRKYIAPLIEELGGNIEDFKAIM